jgi:hypothetical protein
MSQATALIAARALRRRGFTATRALDTWEAHTVMKGNAQLRIAAMPGKHGPGPLYYLLPPVMGSMLEFEGAPGRKALRLYITGDTLWYEELREIPRRYPEIDLALLHLGGTRVLGIMVTMGARQGVEVVRMIRPRKAVPIHYNDYTVFKSPLRTLCGRSTRPGCRSASCTSGTMKLTALPCSKLLVGEDRCVRNHLDGVPRNQPAWPFLGASRTRRSAPGRGTGAARLIPPGWPVGLPVVPALLSPAGGTHAVVPVPEVQSPSVQFCTISK